ncbi:response regulator [Paenibacillus albiflavus]|uniref:Response regulator n=1 Tax=Paenibacillus albiflavus TaxID=2545760 RepID=A0A4R4E203_9BACL|nr:response regulator [Paenibacillus albiflavus]TCZ72877.1 response regulator [Paenibacillus albiflavus]
MYRVLLADDESLDLEGVQRFIPWSDLNMEVVAAVNSGFAALEVMEREAIDILVTDVRMPNMSGLELARKALDKWSSLKIIFISGYQDFHYVKQAIALKAYSYVLKPMDDNELIESLLQIKNELDRDQKRKATEQAYKKVMPIVQNEYLLQLLEGSTDHYSLNLLFDGPEQSVIAWPVRVVILEMDDLAWKLNPYSDLEQQVLLHAFSSLIASLCQQYQINLVCKMINHRMALLLEHKGRVFDDLNILHRWIDEVRAKFPFTMTIGIGGIALEAAQLHDSYRQAITALDYKMFDGKGKLIAYEQLKRTEVEDARKLDIRLDALFHAMDHYELVSIHDEIEGLFRLTTNLRSRTSIHNFAMYIMMKLDSYLNSVQEDLFQILKMEFENLDILLQFETINDIRSWLTKKIFEISEVLHGKKQKKNWKLIQEIEKYMQLNLHSNITLRDLANRFSFTPNYLGFMFKEGTGKSFSEYLVDMRMERAWELLQNPTIKIYEVADQVGYRHLPYFSKQFKETFGMTPNECRRQT